MRRSTFRQRGRVHLLSRDLVGGPVLLLLQGAQQEQKPASGDVIPTPNGCFPLPTG
jgi:hypothetical protein